MARKKQSQKALAAKEEEERIKAEEQQEEEEEYDDDDEEEDEMELLQVELGDMIKVKQTLDEAVAAAVLREIEEDYRLDNAKMGVMMAACAFAMVAQFAPIPFPESRPVLGVCCCIYFMLSGALQLVITFIDEDCILITKPSTESSNADLKSHGVRVRSKFPRFTEWYTVTLEFQHRENSPFVEQRWSVGQFFDKDGMFDEVGLAEEVGKLFSRLDRGEYDTKSDSVAKKNQ